MLNEEQDPKLKKIIDDLYQERHGKEENTTRQFNDLEDKMVTLASEAYSNSTSFLQYKQNEWIEHYNMYNSIHNSYTKYNQKGYGLNKFYVPKTHEFVKSQMASVTQAYFSNEEYVYFTPQTNNDIEATVLCDFETAYFAENLRKNNWWYRFVLNSYEQGILHNFIPVKVVYDADKDMPTADLVAIERFRIHPGANPKDPINSSPYLINIIPMYVYQVKEKMNSGDEYAWNKVSEEELMNSISTFETSVVYARNRNESISERKGDTSLNQHSIVYVHENIIKVDGVDYLFYTLGSRTLLSKIFKLEDVYFHGRPYIVGNVYLEENKLYPSAILDHLKHPQEIVNEMVNVSFDDKKMARFPRLLVRNTSKIDINALVHARPDSIIFTQDPTKDVVPLVVPNQSQAFLPEINMFNAHFDDVSGRMGTSSIAQGQSPDSVGGMQMLNSTANQISELYLRTFNETLIEPVINMMLLITQKYGFNNKKQNEKIVRNLNIKAVLGIPEDQKFNINSLKDKDIDVIINVGMGATNPAMRLEKFLTVITSLERIDPGFVSKLNVDEVIKEAFSIQGYKDVSKYIKQSGVDPMVQQLQQQLQEALSKKEDERIISGKATLLNKQAQLIDAQIVTEKNKAIDISIKSQFGAVQGAEVVATIPEVAPIADQFLQNAGYQHPVVDPMVANDGGENLLGQITNNPNFQPADYENSGNLPFNPTGGLITKQGNVAINNDPLTPTNPDRGVNSGLETQATD